MYRHLQELRAEGTQFFIKGDRPAVETLPLFAVRRHHRLHEIGFRIARVKPEGLRDLLPGVPYPAVKQEARDPARRTSNRPGPWEYALFAYSSAFA